jgi:hypothetical protein
MARSCKINREINRQLSNSNQTLHRQALKHNNLRNNETIQNEIQIYLETLQKSASTA